VDERLSPPAVAAPLAVAVIGLGWIGEAHLADLAARDDVRITAVCDIDAERVADFAGRYGATGYPETRAMFAEHPVDAVWICTPPQHHLAPTLLAVDRGIAVYLEKPIARDIRDAREIVRAVAERGVVCAVGYQWHALELLDRIRTGLAGQRIGYLLGQSIGPTAARPWFLSRARGGGNLLERGEVGFYLADAPFNGRVPVQGLILISSQPVSLFVRSSTFLRLRLQAAYFVKMTYRVVAHAPSQEASNILFESSNRCLCVFRS